jgi:SRSO17 transposase
LDEVGVPEAFRQAKTKGTIALELLDTVRGEGLPGWLAVADAGYGVSEEFRNGLAARGLRYIVGVTDDMVVFTEEPKWEPPGPVERPEGTGGRPRKRPRLADGSPRPVTLRELAARTPLRKVTWREGTKGKLSGHFAWLRVWPGGGWATGQCALAEPIWLLIERQADGKLKYAFSNLPPETTRLRAVRLWKTRWPVEQGYQQMKEELGLDHFEGRSWRGFHHHVCLVMMAYGFLALEQLRTTRDPVKPGKKGVPSRRSLSRRFVARCSGC